MKSTFDIVMTVIFSTLIGGYFLWIMVSPMIRRWYIRQYIPEINFGENHIRHLDMATGECPFSCVEGYEGKPRKGSRPYPGEIPKGFKPNFVQRQLGIRWNSLLIWRETVDPEVYVYTLIRGEKTPRGYKLSPETLG